MKWKNKRELNPEELEHALKMASKISFDISEALSILEIQHNAREVINNPLLLFDLLIGGNWIKRKNLTIIRLRF